jgi:hypothetical protein
MRGKSMHRETEARHCSKQTDQSKKEKNDPATFELDPNYFAKLLLLYFFGLRFALTPIDA